MSENPLIVAKMKEIEDLTLQINSLVQEKAIQEAMLRGMAMMLDESSASKASKAKSQSSSDMRRMRLGAKKRVIYSLVNNGFESMDLLNEALASSDIDSRYTRDVVRKAISSGDLIGDIDFKFSLSGLGQELLEGASLPKGWHVYADLASTTLQRPLQPVSVGAHNRQALKRALFGDQVTENTNKTTSLSEKFPSATAATRAASAAAALSATNAAAAASHGETGVSFHFDATKHDPVYGAFVEKTKGQSDED